MNEYLEQFRGDEAEAATVFAVGQRVRVINGITLDVGEIKNIRKGTRRAYSVKFPSLRCLIAYAADELEPVEDEPFTGLTMTYDLPFKLEEDDDV